MRKSPSKLKSIPVGVSPLQLVNLHRNQRYFVIKLHTWFCLSYFLKTNIKFYSIYQYFMSINSFFNTVFCFSIQPPDYSDPWPRLAHPSSFFLIRLFNYLKDIYSMSHFCFCLPWLESCIPVIFICTPLFPFEILLCCDPIPHK